MIHHDFSEKVQTSAYDTLICKIWKSLMTLEVDVTIRRVDLVHQWDCVEKDKKSLAMPQEDARSIKPLSLSLSLHFNGHFSRWTWVSRYQIVSILVTGRIYRQDLPQNQHFRPSGATRCTDSREIWHSRGARGSAWSREISRQSVHGVGTRPPKVENFHFMVKSRPAWANPLTN